jgi:uncharacterized protein (TIGR02611 family)
MGGKPEDQGATVGVLDRIRANPTGRMALKIAVGVLGTLVVALGVVLLPLPGPGWAVIILGLAIWAVEFAWARNLLQFTRRQVRSWTQWTTRQSLPVRALIGVAGFVFIAAVVWASVKFTFHVDLARLAWRWITGGN